MINEAVAFALCPRSNGKDSLSNHIVPSFIIKEVTTTEILSYP
jgi:hypothetical protein